MIAKLKGIVDIIGEDYVVLDVNGVGYLVFASSKTLARLNRGEAAALMTEMVVREDSISLFGFYEPLEKEWFSTLTKVQGVGSKVCLNILSALSPIQLSQAIAAKDKSSFQRANGVGPKLAERIVVELKDKIVTAPVTDFLRENDVEEIIIIEEEEISSGMDDAISALVNLGYQKIEAYRVVNKVMAANKDVDVSAIIRLSLKEFAGDK